MAADTVEYRTDTIRPLSKGEGLRYRHATPGTWRSSPGEHKAKWQGSLPAQASPRLRDAEVESGCLPGRPFREFFREFSGTFGLTLL